MAQWIRSSGDIAASSHTKGLIGLIGGGLGFCPIVTTTDDPAEIS
jgi:hypothetical protein